MRVTEGEGHHEYPAVGIGPEDLWAAYASDASGLAGLTYVKRGRDGGQSWGEAALAPS